MLFRFALSLSLSLSLYYILYIYRVCVCVCVCAVLFPAEDYEWSTFSPLTVPGSGVILSPVCVRALQRVYPDIAT